MHTYAVTNLKSILIVPYNHYCIHALRLCKNLLMIIRRPKQNFCLQMQVLINIVCDAAFSFTWGNMNMVNHLSTEVSAPLARHID